jgi:hypothetical protein
LCAEEFSSFSAASGDRGEALRARAMPRFAHFYRISDQSSFTHNP